MLFLALTESTLRSAILCLAFLGKESAAGFPSNDKEIMQVNGNAIHAKTHVHRFIAEQRRRRK